MKTLKTKIGIGLGVAALALTGAQAMAAGSAKFAAVYSEDPMVTNGDWSSFSTCEAILDDSNATTGDTCEDGADGSNVATGTTVAKIKVPNQKELLVGVSAQVGLFTETEVRGKKGSTSTAIAFAEGSVGLMACESGVTESPLCYTSVPRTVVLSNRSQELEATLGGVLESCDVLIEADEEAESGYSGSFDLNDCDVSPEEIRLAIKTLAAHHYNFVFPNMPVGEWDIIATFKTDAQTEASANCGDPESDTYQYCIVEAEASARADARAVINNSMVTIQEVRAVKGSLGEMVEMQ